MSDAAPESARATLTHVAIRSTNIEATIDFYRRYAGYSIVHDRTDSGIRVVWLAAEPVRPSMVLVVLEMPHEPAPDPAATDHYGFAVDSRQRVDRIAALARAEKRLKYGPADGGPIVGYFVMVRDPSGNVCEFSYGQPTDPADIPPRD